MRIHILPRVVTSFAGRYEPQPTILRLIAESAAEEAQIAADYTRLKNAGAKVEWYGHEANGSSDHMAIGYDVELA